MIEARVHDEWCPLVSSVTVSTEPDDELLLAGVMVRLFADVSHATLGAVSISPQHHAWRRANG